MTFDDLPTNWPTLPLDDPRLAADVVDLCLRHSDRVKNSALLLLCDDRGVGLQPVVIDGVDWHAVADERASLFDVVGHVGVPAVVVAVSARRPIPSEVALRWRETARAVFARDGVRMLGFFSADQDSVWEPTAEAA